MAIDPTEAAVAALAEIDHDGPIYMLNLLRFREGGMDEYEDYVRHCRLHGPRHGAEFMYLGKGGHVLVGEEGQTWDAVWLVRYPSKAGFFAILHDPDFKSGFHLRSDTLIEAVLQVTTPWEI
ncbi:hypothetical protein [Sphingobium sp.]|uniref:hypothetical protein n=1 Tax=Sphingobium sp. TaxID=1912891 RepID=UPI003B3B8B2E